MKLKKKQSRIDDYAPTEVAGRVNSLGKKKVAMLFLLLTTLGILAYIFIAFGAMFYAVVITGSSFGFGPTRLVGRVGVLDFFQIRA